MLTSFGMLQVFYPEMLTKTDPVSTNAVLIGLGGGLLASFLVNFMPNVSTKFNGAVLHKFHALQLVFLFYPHCSFT